jgi:hypothetical protein
MTTEITPGRYRVTDVTTTTSTAEVTVLEAPGTDGTVRIEPDSSALVSWAGGWLAVHNPNRRPDSSTVRTWDRLPDSDPEPDWQPGHRVTDRNGERWVCIGRFGGEPHWRCVTADGDGDALSAYHRAMHRPLTVTHEPKPVETEGTRTR